MQQARGKAAQQYMTTNEIEIRVQDTRINIEFQKKNGWSGAKYGKREARQDE